MHNKYRGQIVSYICSNTMFIIAICDDNTEFLELERRLIDEHLFEMGEEHEIVCFNSGIGLLEAGISERADLILLDYEMNGMSGLETARKIRESNNKVAIAFVTVFYDFSREGYKVDAIRYLVKQEASFESELKDCVDKALGMKMARTDSRRMFEFADNSLLLELDDIVYVQTDKHYLNFCINTNNRILYRKMRGKMSVDAADLLSNRHFFLVRTGVLINLRYVRSYNKCGAVFLEVKGEDDKMFMISDSLKSSFLSAYAKYYGEI